MSPKSSQVKKKKVGERKHPDVVILKVKQRRPKRLSLFHMFIPCTQAKKARDANLFPQIFRQDQA